MADSTLSAETAQTALANVPPSTDRAANLVLPTSMATEGELKNIERALMNPPPKVNWLTAGTSFLSAFGLAAKSFPGLASGAIGDSVAFAGALAIVGAVIMDTWKKVAEKHPFHDGALEEVRALIALQRPGK